MKTTVMKTAELIAEESKEVFGNFYILFEKAFIEKLYKLIESIESEIEIPDKGSFIMQHACSILHEFMRISVRVLIIELNIAKEKNPNESKDIYEQFNRELKSNAKIEELKLKYPVLFRLLYEIIDYRIELIHDCLCALSLNKQDIKDMFHISVNTLYEMEISDGDSHNKGKKVVLLKFPEGKLVYKPHDLGPEELFLEILDKLNSSKKIRHELVGAKVLNYKKYGFQEYIDQIPCKSEEEAAMYYYRVGALSAIFYALHCEDIHYENLICGGTSPYIIDLETLIKSGSPKDSLLEVPELVRKSMHVFDDSILGTMLYPINSKISFLDFDIGGISGYPNQKSRKWKFFQVEEAGTERIHISQTVGNSAEKKNLLYYKGKMVDPYYFCDELHQGFRDAVEAMIYMEDELVESLKKSDASVRQVLRPTALYGKFLEVAEGPKYLGSEQERERLFEKLFKGFKESEPEKKRVRYEIKALMRNDIPYFAQKINESSLICNMESVIDRYNINTPFETAYRRIKELKNLNIEKQLYYIDVSLGTVKPDEHEIENFRRKVPTYRFENSNSILKMAEEIADKLEQFAEYTEDGKACTWLTALYSNGLELGFLNEHIYEGGGVVLFLLYLWKYTNNKKYLALAKCGMNGLEAMGMCKPSEDVSFFTGSVSTMYLYYSFYSITNDESYRKSLEVYVHKCYMLYRESIVNNLPKTDVIAGISGAIPVLCEMVNKCQILEMNDLIDLLAKHLYDAVYSGKIVEMTGFAHGYAGIALALSTYGNFRNKREYLSIALKVIEKENEYFSEKVSNWKDLRKDDSYGNYWCHGAPGIGLARLKMLPYFEQKDEIMKDVSVGLNCLRTVGLSKIKDDSLCHGSMGNIDMLLWNGKKLGRKDIQEFAQKKAIEFVDKIRKDGFRAGIDGMKEAPSFMLGLPGLGYTLLRLLHQEMPSILALEIPEG